MTVKVALRASAWIFLTFLLLNLGQAHTARAVEVRGSESQQENPGVIVVQSSRSDVSPELRSVLPRLQPDIESALEPSEIPNFILPKALQQPAASVPARPVESAGPTAPDQMPAPGFNFEGVGNMFGGWPPDTQGDIGPNHYIQWINLHFAIWQIDRVNHTATKVYGPVAGNALFQGFGSACEFNNDGDPITLYDPLADRWLMSQFALPNWPYAGPFYQCIAVSTTPDPQGSWYRYEYQMPVNKMNDYPKFGVWPDAYYMTVNMFHPSSQSWAGAGVAAFDRAAMLSGAAADMVFIDLYTVNSNFGGMLPADFDGLTPPPDGAPGYFAEWDDGSWIGDVDALRVWEFDVDWDNPAQSVFGVGGNPNYVLPTTNVDPAMCGMLRNCIPQPGTSMRLDAISDRLMYRLQYRNFGSYATLVTNHTVDVNGSDHAGVHWFEMRRLNSGGAWMLHQDGIYAPDSDHRWMGSAALDYMGNMALGYSLASSAVYPSIRYTGRLAGDPPGSLSQGEVSLIAGSGSQTGMNRWGDYSMMGVDPVDDCTFWYTQEYYPITSSAAWKTRIGSFRFPGCQVGPSGALSGQISSSATGDPIEGAQVQASRSLTQTLTTQTGADGNYTIVAPAGVYTVSASAFGYIPQIETGVEIISGSLTVRDYALDLAATYVISGFVKDETTGWPLYAELTPTGVETPSVWSDPLTGFYSLNMPAGTSLTISALPFSTGYKPLSQPIVSLASDTTLNFDMQVDELACSAIGYELQIDPLVSWDFETENGGLAPSGFSSWAWGTITSGPGSAHSGSKGWATKLDGNYNDFENGYLTLPALDLSGDPGKPPVLSWQQWLETELGYDYASIEASNDNGASWQVVYGPLSGPVDKSWKNRRLTLPTDYAVASLRLRFFFTSDSIYVYPGWYLDDLMVGAASCLPKAGGLVSGNVRDANTQTGLNNSSLTSDSGETALSQPTPDDASLADGFYLIFSPAGTHAITATNELNYQRLQNFVDVPLNGAVDLDFDLQAAWLNYAPSILSADVEAGDTITRTLVLTNQGGVAADFELVELRGGSLPAGPIEAPNFGNKPFKADTKTTEKLGIPAPPSVAPLAAGQVIQSWIPTGADGAWAAAYDPLNRTVWVSSPAASWDGNDTISEFETDGTPTGRSYAHSIPHTFGPADLAYNWNLETMWVMNVNTGNANCIYELDPATGYTGQSICPGGEPGFSLSQRGLAFDPDTDTWFAAGWNDLMVHRFDMDGTILSSVNIEIPVSGLAYNPETQHLFALTNDSTTRIYVLDAAHNYNLVGQFSISQDFGSNAGGGLEFDCQGNFWAVDINLAKVYQVESGEAAALCEIDVPWFTSAPVSGTIGAHSTLPVTITLDASIPAADQPGQYFMQLKVREQTPYPVANLPVTMTVTAPVDWGKLTGSVQSLGYCNTDPHPLDTAQVEIDSSGGLTWTVTTGATGYYQRWLDAQGGPFTVTFSAPEHQPLVSAGVQVTGEMTTTLDASLYWLRSCTSVFPGQIDASVEIGHQVTETLAFDNAGNVEMPFNWFEVLAPGQTEADLDWLSIVPVTGTVPTGPGIVFSTVTLDANAPSINYPGTYLAGLVLETNDPYVSQITVPITLTVEGFANFLPMVHSE